MFAGVRSAASTWLPLHARCVAQTRPERKPNPGAPATSSMVCSSPGLPPREARTHSPTSKRASLRHALERPAAGEVEDLIGLVRAPAARARVARTRNGSDDRSSRRRALAHEPASVQHLEFEVEFEPVRLVDRVHAQQRPLGIVDDLVRVAAEHRGPTPPVAVADEPGRPSHPSPSCAQHGHRLRVGRPGCRRSRAGRPSRSPRGRPARARRAVRPSGGCAAAGGRRRRRRGSCRPPTGALRSARSRRSYFTAPSASPPTKLRWNTRNTIVDGMAAITVAAAITDHDDTYWP